MQSRFLDYEDKTIEIQQDLVFGYAGEVWDAALVLSYFILNKNFGLLFPDVSTKTVLELGAGTGICGIAASLVGAKQVYITDIKENLEISRRNIEINKDKLIKEGDSRFVEALTFDWTNKDDFINANVDLILCSDVIYKHELFEPLIEIFNYYIKGNNCVLMSYTYRKKEDLVFFKMLCEDYCFLVERIPIELHDEVYRAEDTFLIKIYKKE